MTDYIIPAIMLCIILHGIYKKVNVFAAMAHGIMNGLKVCAGIFPAVLIMLTSISMLRASGALELACAALAPVLAPLGLPPECLPLMLLRPFSGSGALTIGSDIMSANGPDSLAGRIAAVMLGASETSIYTLGIYTGYLGLKNTRYALPAVLIGDFAAYVMAGVSVRLLM